MYQAVEAVVHAGHLVPVEPILMQENERFLLVRLGNDTSANEKRTDADFQRRVQAAAASRGLLSGQLSTVDAFMARKQEEKALER